MPAVEVTASGTIDTRAVNPMVMNGSLVDVVPHRLAKVHHRRPRHDAVREIEAGETIGDDVGQEMAARP